MMKHNFTLALLFVSILSFAQDDMPRSAWVSSPITIDGEAHDWKLPLRLYDSGTKLFFAFANDDTNLYLCFQAPDDMFQTKIIRAGMEVAVSAKGKHKVSITFPIAQTSAAEPATGDAEQQSRRTNFILQNTMMKVKGFATRNGIIPINDTSGIHVAMNWDDDNKLTYEIAIPYKEWFGAGYSVADIAKDITLEVTINPLKQARSKNGAGQNIMEGGQGKLDGGRHHQHAESDAETHVMPGEYKYSLYEKRKLKQKFVLAENGEGK